MRALESRRRRAFAISAATAFALCALLLVPAQPAYADIAGDVNDWLCGLLRDCCNWMFKAQTGVLGSIGANGILSADFAHMLTSSSDLTMHDVARGVWQVAILPIGCGVLGLVFTLKLIEISQRMDGSQSLPGVKEVVFLLVFFAVFLFLIQNSFDLMQAVARVNAALPHDCGYLRVAVMGCAVNGPGEATDADIGIAFGDGNGVLFKHGEKFAHGQAEDMIALLVHEATAMLNARRTADRD